MPIRHHFQQDGYYIEKVTRQEDGDQATYLVHALRMSRDAAEEKSSLLPMVDSEHAPEHVVKDARLAYDRIRGSEVFRMYSTDPGLERGEYRPTLPEGTPIPVEPLTIVDVPVTVDDFSDAMPADLGISR